MDYTCYDLVLLFFIYSFLGWCAEVAFAAVRHGQFVNRGFLNGPVCPIYGHGMLLVLVVLEPLKQNPLLLFVGSVLLTSALEFLTGFVLEKCFRTKWWDYSKRPLNLKGYVCLEFSLLWGVACVLIVCVIQPLIYKLVSLLPRPLGVILIFLFTAMIVTDYILTLIGMLKLPKRLRAMEDAQAALRKLSDGIGSGLSGGVFSAMEKGQEFRDKGQEFMEKGQQFKEAVSDSPEAEALRERYRKLVAQKNLIHRRLLRAFPTMQSSRYADSVERLREELRRARAARKSARTEQKQK